MGDLKLLASAGALTNESLPMHHHIGIPIILSLLQHFRVAIAAATVTAARRQTAVSRRPAGTTPTTLHRMMVAPPAIASMSRIGNYRIVL